MFIIYDGKYRAGNCNDNLLMILICIIILSYGSIKYYFVDGIYTKLSFVFLSWAE